MKILNKKTNTIRKTLNDLKKEEAIDSVLRAEQEERDGKLLEGDLDKLAKIYA